MAFGCGHQVRFDTILSTLFCFDILWIEHIWRILDLWMVCSLQTCCECGQDLQTCPICRSAIHTRIKLYWEAVSVFYCFAEILCNLFRNWSKMMFYLVNVSCSGYRLRIYYASSSLRLRCLLEKDEGPRFRAWYVLWNVHLKIKILWKMLVQI